MQKSILLLLITLFFFGCGSQFEEVVEESYPDGNPKLVKHYTKKDRTLIKEITYYPNQQKQSEGEIKEGKMHGKWSFWFQNGQLWTVAYYQENIEHGEQTVWHDNGNKYYQGSFEDGVRTGIWKFWDSSGNLTKTIDYDKQ